MAKFGRQHDIGPRIMRRQRCARSPADNEDIHFEVRVREIQRNSLQS